MAVVFSPGVLRNCKTQRLQKETAPGSPGSAAPGFPALHTVLCPEDGDCARAGVPRSWLWEGTFSLDVFSLSLQRFCDHSWPAAWELDGAPGFQCVFVFWGKCFQLFKIFLFSLMVYGSLFRCLEQRIVFPKCFSFADDSRLVLGSKWNHLDARGPVPPRKPGGMLGTPKPAPPWPAPPAPGPRLGAEAEQWA